MTPPFRTKVSETVPKGTPYTLTIIYLPREPMRCYANCRTLRKEVGANGYIL